MTNFYSKQSDEIRQPIAAQGFILDTKQYDNKQCLRYNK
jgi:hypothetical protein